MLDLLQRLKVNKEPEKNKLIIVAILILLAICLDFVLIIKPQFRGIGAASQKMAKLKKDTSLLNKDLATMEESRREGLEAEKKAGSLPSRSIVKEEEIPLLLGNISDTANKNNVKITQIKPFRDTKQREESVAGVNILPVMITLDLSCGYHSLGSFINALENTAQFMSVQEMKITPASGDFLSQSVSLVLKTYVKK